MLAKLAHAVCAGQAAAASLARHSVDTLDAERAGLLDSRTQQLDPEGCILRHPDATAGGGATLRRKVHKQTTRSFHAE